MSQSISRNDVELPEPTEIVPMWGGALLAAALLIIAIVGIGNVLDTPVGLWKVIDDETNQPLSFVRIDEASGVLSGKLEKLLDPAKKDARCDKCTGERKNQPIHGMEIMRNVKLIGKGVWGDGELLDPDKGQVYHVRLRLRDGGKALEVYGYIGPYLHNQRWVRAE